MTNTNWITTQHNSFERKVGAFKFTMYLRSVNNWHVHINCLPIHYTKSKNYKYKKSALKFCETLITKLLEAAQ